MKKFILVSVSVFLVFSISVSAQSEWEWDTHGIGFTTPSGFKVTTNNAEEFSAESENVFVTLSAWQDENVTVDNLEDTLITIAVELGYDQITDAEWVDHEDFEGYALNGTKDGVNAIIGTLLDTQSSTNLIVIVVYLPGYEYQAEQILMSIYPYD